MDKFLPIPKITELPKPPVANTGWPWTKDDARLPEIMLDGSLWPRISIVTPSYNQGQFLEETIRSVLLQGYPNLEYIIIDGGSTDESVDVIKKYEPWLAYWVSKKDRGQSHAINKGFSQATGEIFGWLNSDDLYLPNSLRSVATLFIELECDILSGNTIYLESGVKGKKKTPSMLSTGEMLRSYLSAAPQPSTFWRRKCWDHYGPLDEALHYRMDYALFLCFAASELTWSARDKDLVLFRRHEEQKTWAWSDEGFHSEKERAIRRFAQFDDFAQRYAQDIVRGLHYEGWLVSWMATNVSNKGLQGLLRMLAAPVYNWRCTLMPSYYRKTLGTISGTAKRLLGEWLL